MLVVTVDLWPCGDRRERVRLGRIDIFRTKINESHTRGDYGVRVYRKDCATDDHLGVDANITRRAEVLDYPRLSYPVWILVLRALKELFEQKRKTNE